MPDTPAFQFQWTAYCEAARIRRASQHPGELTLKRPAQWGVTGHPGKGGEFCVDNPDHHSGHTAARRVADMALQWRVGLLSEWWTGTCPADHHRPARYGADMI